MNSRHILLWAVGAVLALGSASSAQAAVCSNLPSASWSADTSDFTYRGVEAVACQYVSGNDGDTEVDGLFGVADWDRLTKAEAGSSSAENNSLVVGGLTLTFSIDLVSYNASTGVGQYSLVATPGDSALLPLELSLMGVLKQATAFVAFDLSPATIDASNDGTFRSDFWIKTNPNQKETAQIDYSHVSFWGANYLPCSGGSCGGGGGDDDFDVPEPASLALVGVALASAGLAQRRRRQRCG